MPPRPPGAGEGSDKACVSLNHGEAVAAGKFPEEQGGASRDMRVGFIVTLRGMGVRRGVCLSQGQAGPHPSGLDGVRADVGCFMASRPL